MGNIIDEQNLIKTTIDMNESIMETQYTRFLQESPTFVTYYKLSNVESTTDQGFLNVERTIGPDSPIRYNKVNDIPLYGLEQIVLSLDDDEEGFDMNYSGGAIILPNTIVPNPSDHFYINYLGRGYVFQVNNLSLDTIRSNPYYRIEFKIRSIDGGTTADQLDKQSVDEFNCIHTNIGTEDKVLVKSADIEKINTLNSIIKSIEEYYIMAFYDSRYNSFLYNHSDGNRYYDRALTNFIIKTRIFNSKGTYKTIQLTNEAKSPISQLEYHNSIYRALEKRDNSLIKLIKYHLMFVGDFESVFVRWQDSKIRVVEQGTTAGSSYYVRPDLINNIQNAKSIYDMVEDSGVNEGVLPVKHIVLPDINNKPVYVPDANITRKFTESTTIEEASVIPRGECCVNGTDILVAEDGSIDLDALFSSGYKVDDSNLVVSIPEFTHIPEDDTCDESSITPGKAIPLTINEEPRESPIIIVDEQERLIPSSGYTIEKNVPGYLVDTVVSQENVMEVTISKYFGGYINNVKDLDLDSLAEYLDYIDINSFESFTLTPMLLFILGIYTKRT